MQHYQLACRCCLKGTYEATLWAGVINAARHSKHGVGASDVFLTAVGGGVFHNPTEWIDAAIVRAVSLARAAGATINVHICHHRRLDAERARLIDAALERAALAASPLTATGIS
jgi:hypothetical protein